MGDLLHLDRAERHAAVLAALAAVEQLRDLRQANGNHTPADSELIDLASSAPPSEAAELAEILDRFVRIAAAGWDKTSGGNLSFIPNGSLDSGSIAALLAAGVGSRCPRRPSMGGP